MGRRGQTEESRRKEVGIQLLLFVLCCTVKLYPVYCKALPLCLYYGVAKFESELWRRLSRLVSLDVTAVAPRHFRNAVSPSAWSVVSPSLCAVRSDTLKTKSRALHFLSVVFFEEKCLLSMWRHVPLKYKNVYLYVLLTVHFSNILFLVSNLMHLFIISFHILYMFRAILCSSLGESTVYTQHVVLYVSRFLCDT